MAGLSNLFDLSKTFVLVNGVKSNIFNIDQVAQGCLLSHPLQRSDQSAAYG